MAVGVAAMLALYAGSSTPPSVGRGTTAPDFSLPSLIGDRIVDLESLSGEVVLVNFWATWCKPCEDEMPAMERLYRTLSDSGFELIAISVDDDRALVERFASRLGLSFPILLDPQHEAATAYQTFRFPESLLVGRDGVIVERYIGPKDWDAAAYVTRIRKLLAEPAAS
ncbi:MAG: TlpA disulfide reductase family protein [Myxococcota bacterium]